MNILVVGGGGREHAIAHCLSKSPLTKNLIVAPGNPGIKKFAECYPILADDIEGQCKLAKDKNIDPRITQKIWKTMIKAFIDYEYRNFKKK